MQKYTPRVAHLERGEINLDFAVEDDVLPSAEPTHEGDRVGETQSIVEAPPQGDLASIGFEKAGIANQAGARRRRDLRSAGFLSGTNGQFPEHQGHPAGLSETVLLAGLASDFRAPSHSDFRVIHPDSERLRTQHPSRFPDSLRVVAPDAQRRARSLSFTESLEAPSGPRTIPGVGRPAP